MTTSVVVCTYCCAVLLMDYRNVGRQNLFPASFYSLVVVVAVAAEAVVIAGLRRRREEQ